MAVLAVPTPPALQKTSLRTPSPGLPDLPTAPSTHQDDRADLDADTSDMVALAAHMYRARFALRNHRDAVLHFRKMAADTKRSAAMYSGKIDAHIAATRKRVTLLSSAHD